MDRESLERRIRSLEKRRGQTYQPDPLWQAATWELCNATARARGEEPRAPEVSHEDRRELAEWVLGSVIPKYRNEPGWQSPEAQALLDAWEEEARRELEGDVDD